ncbi:MAG: M24 family metallopeptidase [Coprothermobacterota bacterium]|nr:M24 family metallopeptidase [Coprothermobacterota bacterium]
MSTSERTLFEPTRHELEVKEAHLRDLMGQLSLDALLLSRRDTFAWITGGRNNHVNKSSEWGFFDLLFLPHRKYCLASRIEALRAMEEELAGQGFELADYDWWKGREETVRRIVGKGRLGADGPFPRALEVNEALRRLRFALLPDEVVRFREVGRITTDALEETAREIQPGWSEHRIAARISERAMSEGVDAVVTLVATDERVYRYRHPIDTGKRLQRYAMLVLCGRKYGLVANLTRLVHFGSPPGELREKLEKVTTVDAEMIACTVVGAVLADIFHAGMAAYAAVGYPEEWKQHHQGGVAGYNGREILALPNSQETVLDGQAFAWNPSIRGVKSEDTILVQGDSREFLTASGHWPTLEVLAGDGTRIQRPDLLVR